MYPSNSGFTVFLVGFNNQPVGNVTNCTVTGLLAGSNYWYRLRAQDSGGTSTNSAAVGPITLAGGGTVTVNNVSGPTNITASSAWLIGVVTCGTGTVYVYWGDTDGGTNKNSWTNAINIRYPNPRRSVRV